MYGLMFKYLGYALGAFLALLFVVLGAAHAAGGDVIPAMQVLYTTSAMKWIITGRITFFICSAVALLFLGALMISSGEQRSAKFKLRAWALGLAMLTTSAMETCFIGLILYGGVWHFAAFFAGGLNAMSVIVAALVGFGTQLETNKALRDEKAVR